MSDPRIENDDAWHVVPINDLREHILNGSCWCKPEMEEDGSGWIHNSMDGDVTGLAPAQEDE